MRKSKQLRLSQAEDLLQKYNTAGISTSGAGRFLSDMTRKMRNGKYPTTRQRAWLDKLIEEGVPEPKGDLEYIAKIDEALATEGIDFAQVLTDFRGKLARGWDLSEKQKNWCDGLIEKAEDIRSGNYWRPDDAMKRRITLAVSVKPCYNATFWSTHAGGASAMAKAEAWLAGNLLVIDEWTVNKLFKTVAGKLREMENPRFEPGNMGYVSVFDREKKQHVRKPGIIVAGPIPVSQGLAYDILIDGEITTSINISKRR